MKNSNKIINFPKKIDIKKKKYAVIRDEVESFLYQCACDEKDLWAVAMAAGRFSSIFLSKIEGDKTAIDFFKNCIETQKNFEKSRDFSDVT